MTKQQANNHNIVAACVALLFLTGCVQRATDVSQPKQSSASTTQATRVSPENTDAAEPSLAAGPDGSLYVVWVEHRAKKEADVFVTRLDNDGRVAGEAVRVNPNAGEAKAWHGDPPTIVVAPDKTIYVGWTARITGAGHGTTLYLSASRDGGRSFATPVKVNDDDQPASHGMHSLAVSTDNRVSLAWLDERNVAPAPEQMPGMNQTAMNHAEPNSEVFTAYSVDGGRTFTKNQRLATEACPCCKTALVAGPDNRIYVSWRQVLPGDLRHIAVIASTDGGENFNMPQIVSDDTWKITGCPVSGPALAIAGDNSLRVVWYTAGERGVAGLYWSETKDDGHTFSPRQLLAGGTVRGNPQLHADGKRNLTVVWESNDEAEARVLSSRLASDGKATSGAVLAKGAELPAVTMTGEQLFVSYIGSANDRRSIWIARAQAGG